MHKQSTITIGATHVPGFLGSKSMYPSMGSGSSVNKLPKYGTILSAFGPEEYTTRTTDDENEQKQHKCQHKCQNVRKRVYHSKVEQYKVQHPPTFTNIAITSTKVQSPPTSFQHPSNTTSPKTHHHHHHPFSFLLMINNSARGLCALANCKWYEYTLEPWGMQGMSYALANA